MTAKEYFQDIADAEVELRRLQAIRDHYADLAASITVTGGGGSIGGHHQGSSRVELAAIGIVDTSADIDEAIQRYRDKINAAVAIINRLPQKRWREVLSYRYLCGMGWQAVADTMGYRNKESVFKAHGFALKAAQTLLTDQ